MARSQSQADYARLLSKVSLKLYALESRNKREFLVEPQILKGAIRPVSWRSFLLDVWGRSSFTKEVVFQLLRLLDANLRHTITHKVTVKTYSVLKFIQVSLRKVKVK
jgi:hypothetical protein